MAYIMQDVQSRFQPLINTLKKTKQLEPVQLLTSPEVAKLDDAEDSDDGETLLDFNVVSLLPGDRLCCC